MRVEHRGKTMPAGEKVLDEFKPKNVLFLIDMVTASSWYRCDTPGAELARLGHDVWTTVCRATCGRNLPRRLGTMAP